MNVNVGTWTMDNQVSARKIQEILEDCETLGSVTAAAEKHGVSRQSIYNWKKKQKSIELELASEERFLEERAKRGTEALQNIDSYATLLNRLGTLEQRKAKLSAHVEFILANVVSLLEKHPDLDKIHPKDLSKIMVDLHSVRKELSNEPTIIVEYKNKMREQVLRLLVDYLSREQLEDFAGKMEAIEAEYEVLS